MQQLLAQPNQNIVVGGDEQPTVQPPSVVAILHTSQPSYMSQQDILPAMPAQGMVSFDLANRQGNEEMLQLLVNASIAAEAQLFEEMPDDDT